MNLNSNIREAADMNKKLCVISHTHWDREWYMPFELFRLRLVDLIDRLFGILEKNPEYIFHLDAQTVVLEDYLEIRPEKRDLLKEYITKGNIVVGPWYLQNDFYLTSGEATIRNLLVGTKIAESFGKCTYVGYVPDQFGNISQLPQILKNFGIDNFIFGRGFGPEEFTIPPREFIWQGADGSELLAIHMSNWYNNAQRISTDAQKAKRLADIIESNCSGGATTEYLLLMNGVDHLEAQDDLLEAINNYNQIENVSSVMKQYNLQQYVEDVKAAHKRDQTALYTYKGELRQGHLWNILPGTLSSRSYLKTANIKMQNTFEKRLEPLHSMLELCGCSGFYSYDHFQYGWKKLLQNHPHDSICGCSRDEVHDHMEDNYQKLSEFSEELLRRGLVELFYHSEAVRLNKHKYAIHVVNTTSIPLSNTVRVTVDFLPSDHIKNFTVTDIYGNPVEFKIISKQAEVRDIVSPLNLPCGLPVDRYEIYINADHISPFSSKGYYIVPNDKEPESVQNTSSTTLENEWLKVSVEESGKINVYFKKTGAHFEDILYFEDITDRGCTYNHDSGGDSPITTEHLTPTIETLEHNEFNQSVKLSWDFQLPESYLWEERKRSNIFKNNKIDLILSLNARDSFLNISYCVDNQCCDHRLRIVFDSHFVHSVCYADTPFDIIKREKAAKTTDLTVVDFPNSSFVAMQQANSGFAILTEGTQEAEILDDSKIALTLVRSTGVINRSFDTLQQNGGQQWRCPGNQCIRTIAGRFAVVNYEGNVYDANLPNLVTAFTTPLCAISLPCDRKLFSGGSPAVQDTELEELFYLPDYYEDALMADNQPPVSVAGKFIHMSAMKLSEDKKGIVLRFYNSSDSDTVATLRYRKKIYQTNMQETDRTFLGEGTVEIPVKSKEIITTYLEL